MLRLLVLISVIVLTSFARAEVGLSSFSDIASYVTSHPSCTMEDVISQLSPELRSSYSLVYSSRSPIEGTLEKPRVILVNKDASLAIAFAGDSSLRGGQRLEFIEKDSATSKYKMRQIDFSKSGNERIEKEPQVCMGCHSTKESKLGARMLWDTYPDWVGIYGSSHAGELKYHLGQPYLVGTSTLKIFDFEKNAFENFLSQSASSGRYSRLLNLPTTTMGNLLEANTEISNRINRANFDRILGAVLEVTEGTHRDRPHLLKSFVKLDQALHGTRPISKEDYDRRLAEAKKGADNYFVSKITRVKELVEKFGTGSDKASIAQGIATISSDNSSIFEAAGKHRLSVANTAEPSYYAILGKVLEDDFGIPSSDLSFTRELSSNTTVSGSGENTAQGSQIRDTLSKIFARQMAKELRAAKNLREFEDVFIEDRSFYRLDDHDYLEQVKPTLSHLRSLVEDTNGDYLGALNDIINNGAFSKRAKSLLAEEALEISHHSIEELNFLANKPTLDLEMRKSYFREALNQVNDKASFAKIQLPSPRFKDEDLQRLFVAKRRIFQPSVVDCAVGFFHRILK